MHSIRFKITAITIAAILTTLVCVLAVSFTSIQMENDHKSAEMMNLLCQNKQNTLDQYFVSIEQAVEMAANIATDDLDSVMLVESGAAGSASARGARSAEQIARFDSYLVEYCEQVREVFASAASHMHGVITYYYCINPEISETQHGFFYSRVGKTGFDRQEPIDARELDPEDAQHNAWYYTPIERGRPSWVEPYTSHFLDEMWICSYLIPIYKAGVLIGVLGMDIPVETLIEQIRNVQVYETGFASLLGPDDKVIYHPNREVGDPANLQSLDIPAEQLAQKSSGDQMIRYTMDGEERQMAFATLSSGMRLVIAAPVSEINASWMRLLHLLTALSAGILVFFTTLLFFVMQIITLPLKRLTDASQRLAAAEYDVELDYQGRDEIGVLTSAFKQMRDKIKSYIEDLNRRISTDWLTGLPNMRTFFKLAQQEHDELLKQGKRPVMLYVNLIGMKHYNRQYGFEEGDKLIRDIGDILAGHYGAQKMCRFSEDHFAVVTDENGLETRLHRVLTECRNANGGKSVPVRVGIYPDGIENVNVSIACDRAKFACDLRRGSYVSGFSTFNSLMLRQIENVRYIINNLDQALEEHWVRVYYQPIVRSSSGRICDEEALSRWIDPVKGFLSPADFIPVLENARLIYKLDLYVLDAILEKMHAQAEAGLYIVPHSLNLSRVDFDACDIVEEIRRRVDAAGIPRDRLTIEVTESMVGRDFEFMKRQIERLQALGFRVWMDDFGSGYSTLGVLQDVHFDLLKFDMRFLQSFGEGEESRIILTELVQMARGLGMETVCEGVETREEVAFLRDIGCTKQQGFFYSKPIPFEEITERCKQGTYIGYEENE